MVKKTTESVDNQNLFGYGLLANLKKVGGWVILFIAVCVSFALSSWLPFLLGLALGGYLIYKGSAERFDYKRRSGTIIHKGDF